jgi:hypothetical protein
MSFWKGLGRAMESNEAQRNVEDAQAEREAARGKDEAWKLKVFDYNVAQDKAVAKAKADQLSFEQTNTLVNQMGVNYRPGGGGRQGQGKPSGSKPTRTTNENMEILVSLGASKDIVAEWGGGYGNQVLHDTINAYDSYKKGYDGPPSGLKTLDDFMAGGILTNNPGSTPDVEALAVQYGLKPSMLDEVSGNGSTLTWRDVITAKLGQDSSTSVTFSSNQVSDRINTGSVVDQANSSVESNLLELQGNLANQLQGENLSDEDKARLSARAGAVNDALTALKDGRAATAISMVGPNAILSQIMNYPDGLTYNYGGGWDQAIEGVTFETEEDINEALANGSIDEGDYYVFDGKIKTLELEKPVDITFEDFNNMSEEEIAALSGTNFTVDSKRIRALTPATEEEKAAAARKKEEDARIAADASTTAKNASEGTPDEDAPAWAAKPVVDSTAETMGRGRNKVTPTVEGPMDNMTEEEVRSQLDDPNITNEGVNRVYDVLDRRFPLTGRGSRRHPRPNMEMSSGLDNPKVRDALSKVPAEVKGAVTSIVAENDAATIEGAISEITDEYGEDVAVSLFTEAGYQPPSMVATELNNPKVRSALASKVGSELRNGSSIKQLLSTIDDWGKKDLVPKELIDKIDAWGQGSATPKELLVKLDTWGKGGLSPQEVVSKIDEWGKSGMSPKAVLLELDAWGKGDLVPSDLLSKIDAWGKSGVPPQEILAKIDAWGKGTE